MRPLSYRQFLAPLAALYFVFQSGILVSAETIVVHSPIKGEISKGMSYLIHRTVEEAKSLHADLIIFEIDTNGGRLDATEEIMQTLINSPIRTASFINTKAFSAGAFIAVATDSIYMSPASVIGAATPVAISPTGSQEETSSSYEEKITSGTRALIKTAAQHKGHPDNIVAAMVDKDVGIEGVIEKGKLLTLTNSEAESEKIKLSKGTIGSIQELLAKENITDYTLHEITPSWSENIALLITNSGVSGILMMLGMLGIYLEFKTPGWGLGGTFAIIAFALFFWGHHIAGLAGMEDVLLFLFGAILLGIEIFIIPGFGVIGMLGFILIFVSLVLSMIRHPFVFPEGPSGAIVVPNLTDPVISLSIAFLGSALGAMVLAKFLPRTSVWSKIALTTEQNKDVGYSAISLESRKIREGQTGRALTVLRPSGKADFDGHTFDVLTEDTYIEAGAEIVVSKVSGNNIVVEKREA